MEDLLIQILKELKNINKKLDAVTPSQEFDAEEFKKTIHHFFQSSISDSL